MCRRFAGRSSSGKSAAEDVRLFRLLMLAIFSGLAATGEEEEE
jgi:hypothetical protein